MSSNIITGFHAIEERVLSLSKKQINPQNYSIFYSKVGPRVKKIISSAQNVGIACTQKPDSELDELVKNLHDSLQDHRGIVLVVEEQNQTSINIVDFNTWLKTSNQEKQTVVILDRITDPHNVGAIIRSCDQFGVSLVVIPEHKSASSINDNDIIARTSAGASAWVPVAIVKNLVRTVELLKENNFWIYGADAGGEHCNEMKFPPRKAIIMGSEGTGIAKLLKEKCDSIISIPTCGKIDSLNVSVATGILLYELYK